MRLGSFCTGYGGLDMAVSAHYGADLAWYSEVDKDCNQLLAHHWPGVSNLGDLTTIDWDQVEPVDIMCAGFPCQPFSTAGRRLGEEDERAIFHYIADTIRILRPRVAVLENVSAITSLGGPGVIGALAGLGYDCRWGIVRASDAGAPHRRARWFCIATDTDDSRQPFERPVEAKPHGRRYEGSHITRGGEATTAPDIARLGRLRRMRPSALLDCSQRSVLGRDSAVYRRGTSRVGWGHYARPVTGWERTIGRPAPAPTDDGKLSSRFVEWMMGLPDGHVCALGLSRTAELKMLGNGVCPQQAALALALLDD